MATLGDDIKATLTAVS